MTPALLALVSALKHCPESIVDSASPRIHRAMSGPLKGTERFGLAQAMYGHMTRSLATSNPDWELTRKLHAAWVAACVWAGEAIA